MITEMNVSLAVPAGATFWTSKATSGANAAGTITVAAVAGKKHYVLGYLVATRAATTANDAAVTITDDATAKIIDYIGAAALSGTRVGIASPVPIVEAAAVNKALTLVAAAAGAGVITESAMWGYTL